MPTNNTNTSEWARLQQQYVNNTYDEVIRQYGEFYFLSIGSII